MDRDADTTRVMHKDGEIAAQTVEGFLDTLASDAPAPGGGAAAALSAAMGAALVSMVCNLTVGRERYQAHEEVMRAALAEADDLRVRALALATADGDAFGAVGAAYALPRKTDEEKAARTARVQEALKGAAGPPLRTVAVAARVVELCVEIAQRGNPNVVSDVGVAALSARAALDGAALNVRVNLALIRDEDFTRETAGELDRYLGAARPLVDDALRAVDGVMAR